MCAGVTRACKHRYTSACLPPLLRHARAQDAILGVQQVRSAWRRACAAPRVQRLRQAAAPVPCLPPPLLLLAGA